MKTGILAGSCLAGLVLFATPLWAQRVSAEVVVRDGPIAGRVIVGDGYSSYHRPVVVYRRPPVRRVVVVERLRYHHGKHWKRRGYRPVVVYYVDGHYFDRFHPHRRGVQEVVVYERDGRYYRDDDDHYISRYDRGDHGDRDYERDRDD